MMFIAVLLITSSIAYAVMAVLLACEILFHWSASVADLGTNSVSGTLSSLQHCNPRDDFDMFAQTRGSSLAEQRKKYVGVYHWCCLIRGLSIF